MNDSISRQGICDWLNEMEKYGRKEDAHGYHNTCAYIAQLPSAQLERLTDDDFETIRIHLNAHKEKLCNQKRWEEAEEYQRIIDRFMAFASAQPELIQLPERRKGKWGDHGECPFCSYLRQWEDDKFCANCGADMREVMPNE